MEVGGTDTIFTAPRHPYTAGLINSIPQRGQPLQGVPGTIFDLRTPPPGLPLPPALCPRPASVQPGSPIADSLVEKRRGHRVACIRA